MTLISRRCKTALSLASLSGALLLAGCGIGSPAGPGSETIGLLSGHAMGGYQPVVGATVTLWEAASDTGYGTGAKSLASSSVTTGTDGSWSFGTQGSTNCDAGQMVYVVAAAGKSGASTANTNNLEMAPVGICGSLNANTTVNELTTVASAYAFGNFASVSGTGASATIKISAPANNNSTASTNDLAVGSTGTVTTASGLYHAYLNAINLVNPATGVANTASVSGTGSVPQALLNTIADTLQSCVNSTGGSTGTFSAPTTPTDSTGSSSSITFSTSSTTVYGSVGITFAGGTQVNVTEGTSGSPVNAAGFAANINGNTTLTGDGVSAAVNGNTVTVSGPAGATNTLAITSSLTGQISDGSTCGELFALTPSRNGVLPTNTFQAAMNMAKNPYVSAGNVSGLFGLITAQSAFKPVLSSAPSDWTVIVSYQVPPVTGQTTSQPTFVSLDADDNVYVTTSWGSVNLDALTTGTAPTQSCIDSFTSSGTVRSGANGWCNFNATPGDNNYTWAMPDALGNLMVNNYYSATGALGWYQIAAQPVTISSTAYPAGTLISGPHIGVYTSTRYATLAINKNNDIFQTANINGPASTSFYWFPYVSTAPTTYARKAMGTPEIPVAPKQIAIDPNLNVWWAEFGSTTGVGGQVGFDYYGTGFTSSSAFVELPIAGGSNSGTAPNSAPIGIAIDANGYAWVTNQPVGTCTPACTTQLTQVKSTSSSAIAVNNTVTNSALNKPEYPEVDGDGVLWFPDTGGTQAYDTVNSVFISQTANPSAGTPSGGFEPCALGYQGTATICQNSWSTVSRNLAIDSTGSVWYLYPTSTSNPSGLQTGRLEQIIGTAAPTWPLLATTKPGVRPQ